MLQACNVPQIYFVKYAKALFTTPNILQNVPDFPSHRILRRMHEALNIGKKDN